MNVTTNVQGPAQVGRMENGDRAVNVQGGMARSTQAGQGQETQLCSAGGKDKTQREGAKKPQLEAAPGSWVGLVGDPETPGPLSPPHHTDGSTLSPSPLICRCWPRWTCPMPGADTLLGPWGLPAIVSVPGWWILPPTGPAWALPRALRPQRSRSWVEGAQ